MQAGWTIARAINTGVMYPSSFVGCHAGDHESYTVFQELFDPVIEGYHKGYKVGESKHVTDMDVSKITTDLTDLAKSKIVSTRIRVARNLAMFPLNPGANRTTDQHTVCIFSGLRLACLFVVVCSLNRVKQGRLTGASVLRIS